MLINNSRRSQYVRLADFGFEFNFTKRWLSLADTLESILGLNGLTLVVEYEFALV